MVALGWAIVVQPLSGLVFGVDGGPWVSPTAILVWPLRGRWGCRHDVQVALLSCPGVWVVFVAQASCLLSLREAPEVPGWC